MGSLKGKHWKYLETSLVLLETSLSLDFVGRIYVLCKEKSTSIRSIQMMMCFAIMMGGRGRGGRGKLFLRTGLNCKPHLSAHSHQCWCLLDTVRAVLSWAGKIMTKLGQCPLLALLSASLLSVLLIHPTALA